MGRYDALTKLEEQPTEKTPFPEATSQNTKKTPSQSDQKPNQDVKKPEIMKTRNHENESPLDIPVKYSTLIRTHFIKRIKIHAAETDLKDYEVIELALTEFFKKH
jgi:hypothetical protein